jgi:hypothetical protein
LLLSSLVHVLSSQPAANLMGARKSARNISSTISTVTSEDLIASDAETDMDPERTLIGMNKIFSLLTYKLCALERFTSPRFYPKISVIHIRRNRQAVIIHCTQLLNIASRVSWTTGASRDSMRVRHNPTG